MSSALGAQSGSASVPLVSGTGVTVPCQRLAFANAAPPACSERPDAFIRTKRSLPGRRRRSCALTADRLATSLGAALGALRALRFAADMGGWCASASTLQRNFLALLRLAPTRFGGRVCGASQPARIRGFPRQTAPHAPKLQRARAGTASHKRLSYSAGSCVGGRRTLLCA
ncbi:MAG: hypothetical protein RL385_3213 [Pseudomonadota bacterium]